MTENVLFNATSEVIFSSDESVRLTVAQTYSHEFSATVSFYGQDDLNSLMFLDA